MATKTTPVTKTDRATAVKKGLRDSKSPLHVTPGMRRTLTGAAKPASK